MKKIIIGFIAIFATLSTIAQEVCTVSGVVNDEAAGYGLPFASVKFNDKGTFTNAEGQYSIELPYGEYTVTASTLGLEDQVQKVTLNSPTKTLNFNLQQKMMDEVRIVTDLIVDRETPVPVSNIKPLQIQEELGSQPIPMILNATPGVYASQEGSDDTGPSISIRGFKQRNVSVMIDGIPVNDMEDGRVFWNNWFGLDLVTETMQVQRGLGASKLALPAIGGTVNIVTQGIEAKRQTSVKQEYGTTGFVRTTVGHSSGRLAGGWGFTLAGSYKRDDGWIDQTGSEAAFYYVKVQKEFGNHVLSASAMGAPSLNNTRSYQQRISTHDKDYAAGLFTGSNAEYLEMMAYSQQHRAIINGPNSVVEIDGNGNPVFAHDILVDSLNQAFGYSSVEQFEDLMNQTSFIDTSDIVQRGLRYNIHWGDVNGDPLNERQNRYHKPLFTLRHGWNVNDKLYINNTFYASYGRGGGTALSPGLGSGDYNEQGQVDFQRFFEANTQSISSIDPLYSDTERKAGWILRKNFNNHQWYGLLSTFKYDHNEAFTFSGGVDFRTYRAQHYAEVFDLIGADYFVPNQILDGEDPMKRVGDRIDFDNEVFVNWGGMFGLVEYKHNLWNAFLNVSAVYQGYNRIDNFWEPEDAETFGSQKETGWKWIPGFTVKSGGSYKVNEWMNVFMNAGHLNRTPVSRNVIAFDNKFVENIENERINSLELGAKYSRKAFAVNLNGYYTQWNNRPLDVLLSIETPEGDRVRANINSMNALHMGAELDVVYQLNEKWSMDGYISLGDWRWTSSEDSLVLIDELTNQPYQDQFGETVIISYDAEGVSVGDSPQSQYSIAVKYFNKGFYFKPRYTFFDRYFADFDPFSLFDENEGRQSWQIPSYGLLDLHAGYGFDWGATKVNFTVSLFNALNTTYIINAQNNDALAQSFYTNPNTRYSLSENNFDASSASVYMGLGRRANFSMRVRF